MLNNKGQSIVVFALVLPFLLLMVAYVYDVVSMNYYKSKVNGIARVIKDNNGVQACLIAQKNDSDIICEENTNSIILKKRVKAIFGRISKRDYYEINVTINLGDV